jgi:hypothetical protein
VRLVVFLEDKMFGLKTKSNDTVLSASDKTQLQSIYNIPSRSSKSDRYRMLHINASRHSERPKNKNFQLIFAPVVLEQTFESKAIELVSVKSLNPLELKMNIEMQ